MHLKSKDFEKILSMFFSDPACPLVFKEFEMWNTTTIIFRRKQSIWIQVFGILNYLFSRL